MKVEQDPNLSPGASGATTDPAAAASSHEQRNERGRAATMPCTMLRYAIEHLDDEQRANYLSIKGRGKQR